MIYSSYRFSLLALISFLILHSTLNTAEAQSLQARADTLVVPTSGLVFHPADALLANDVIAPEDSVVIVMAFPPANGTLTDLGGGFFRYDPKSGFLGEDSFRYMLETVPIQRFAIDPEVSVLSFDSTVETVLGVAEDDEEIPVEGVITVAMGNDPAAIDSVHVLDANMQNQGPHSLNFNFGSPISVGSLRIVADPGVIQLSILSPGPTSGATGVLNSWEQVDNLVHVSVTALLEGGGLIANQVPDTPQQLETETTESLTGALFASGEQVLFLMNVASSGAFDLDGNAVTLDIAGSLQASGTFVGSQTSNEAEVLVRVVSGASTEDVVVRAGFELDVFPVPVSDQLTVRTRTTSDVMHGPIQITVHDALGRVIERRTMSPNAAAGEMNTTFDTSNWASGLYLVRVAGSRSRVTRSIIRH